MRRRRLAWHIFLPFLLIILCSLLAIGWTISSELETFQIKQTSRDLEARASLTRELIAGRMDRSAAAKVDALCKKLGSETGTRLTVVLADGTVLGDSDEQPSAMNNHANRPEIARALSGEVGSSRRFSHTLSQNMLYVAIPVSSGGEIIGSVRAALAITALEQTLAKITSKLVGGGAAVALIAALVALAVAGRIGRPLSELQAGARRFAAGELDQQITGSPITEVDGLAQAMNSMARQLDEKLRALAAQRNEQEAVLTSMIEGVIAIDPQRSVLRINHAAACLLGTDPTTAAGRSVGELTRKVDLLHFIEETVTGDRATDRELTLLQRDEERVIQAQGAPLRDVRGEKIGALIVLHDVTRLRRLESLRRDFVANVSHELKTPITAIKGAIETLRDGAVDDPQAAGPILAIAARQTERLNAIIEDLLALSRLERDAEAGGIELDVQTLKPVLEAALQACAPLAAASGIETRLFCSDQLQARLNAPLLEQAVINLVDNAIKYSGGPEPVLLEAWQDGDSVTVRVQDHGRGIAAEHLPRLFERFYRVDGARSRAVGGTGLGLAIVKHIVQAHRGEITAHSTPGQGSVFQFTLAS